MSLCGEACGFAGCGSIRFSVIRWVNSTRAALAGIIADYCVVNETLIRGQLIYS